MWICRVLRSLSANAVVRALRWPSSHSAASAIALVQYMLAVAQMPTG